MRLALSLLLVVVAGLALAHHRQSDAVLPLPAGGDVVFPRVPPPGKKTLALVRPGPGGTEVVGFTPFRARDAASVVFATGNNANPTVSYRGVVFAWDSDADPLGSGAPGRQVFLKAGGTLMQAAVDPTGTSENPALDPRDLHLVFDSTGDLAGAGNAGARQVFVRRPDGTLVQVSRGTGTSRNAVVNTLAGLIAFASTSDARTGADTGVTQLWLAPLAGGPATPLTSGAGSSDKPVVSSDGRVLVFESAAALATDAHDTGVPQVFAYDPRTATFAQITTDAGGCTDPAVSRIKRDWRITFVCEGAAFFYMLRADQRHHVATDGGHTSAIVPQFGVHFVVVSTTADLIAGGVTPTHQAYVVNLFKRPAVPVPGTAVWFPSRGIPPF